MDHLPIPPGSTMEPFPYLRSTIAYDLDGFNEFPLRHGITTSDIMSMTRSNYSPVVTKDNIVIQTADEMESFLQEWLYFGVLPEFGIYCRKSLDIHDFISSRDEMDNPTLTTEPLILYAKDLAIRQLQQLNVPIDLQVGESVILHDTPLHESMTMPVFIIVEDHGNLRYSLALKSNPEQKLESKSLLAANLRRLGTTGSEHSLQHKRDRPRPKTTNQNLQYTSQALYDNLSLVYHLSRKEDFYQRSRAECLSQVTLARTLRSAHFILNSLIQAPDAILQLHNGLAISLLHSALARTLYTIFNEDVGLDSSTGVLNFYLEDHMKARNWCPAQINVCVGRAFEVAFFASCLQNTDRRHHGSCDISFCAYRKRHLADQYPSHHRKTCESTCEMKMFDGEKLLLLLRSHKIPGIRQCYLENGEIDYVIEDATDKRYVAISHVWSHGLGNSFQNGIWSCQLQNLFEKIRSLGEGNGLLWIDTILVPHGEYKTLALPTMKDVYRGATKVLVIDAQLSEVGAHHLEQRFQLILSEWMTRLWTLQEAKLASSLYVQFREGPVAMEELLRQTPPPDDNSIFVSFDYYDWTYGIFEPLFDGEPEGGKFLAVARILSLRSATVKDDEPIVLDTLLDLKLLEPQKSNLDSQSKLRMPGMEDIYMSHTEIPMDFLFIQSPRLRRVGLRWAPESFLEHGPSALGFNYEHATRTEDGLHLSSDCVTLDTSLDSINFSQHADHLYAITCHQSEMFAFTQLEPLPPMIQPLGKTAIIFQKQGKEFSRTSVGALVRIIAERGKVFQCTFILLLKTWRTDTVQIDLNPAFLHPLLRGKHTIIGKFHGQQSFCID